MANRDHYTGDLFEVPVPREPVDGALDLNKQLRALISKVLKECSKDRHEIAAAMSRLTGQNITKFQLDSWTAESREGWRFPLEYLPALEVACETHAITAWIVSVRGGKLLIGKEALEAELGKLTRQQQEISNRAKALKKTLGGRQA